MVFDLRPHVDREHRVLTWRSCRSSVGARDCASHERDPGQSCPTLAVEIISLTNTADEVAEKLEEYYRAGVRMVWVVYPVQMKIYAYTSTTQVRVLAPGDELDGGNVLPGSATDPAASLRQGWRAGLIRTGDRDRRRAQEGQGESSSPRPSSVRFPASHQNLKKRVDHSSISDPRARFQVVAPAADPTRPAKSTAVSTTTTTRRFVDRSRRIGVPSSRENEKSVETGQVRSSGPPRALAGRRRVAGRLPAW